MDDHARPDTAPTWRGMGPAAKLFRIAHTAWAVVGMVSLGYIWLSALTHRRDRLLFGSVGFLSVEGLALVVGRGDCPFGPLQARLGDPVPLFELVLPPRVAKAAVPLLVALTVAAIVTLALRRPRGVDIAASGPLTHTLRTRLGTQVPVVSICRRSGTGPVRSRIAGLA